MDQHVYLRTFSARPVIGETVTVTMPLATGFTTSTTGTYNGVLDLEGELHHSLSNAVIDGPMGQFVSEMTCWPVRLTAEVA